MRACWLALLCLLTLPVPATLASDPAGRLAEAVRYRTISYQDRSLVDYEQFRLFNAFLRESFPRVFGTLEVEAVNEHSLLMHWPGSDPGLAPILFTAHSDVVPIEPGTADDWPHPPFAGVVADGAIYGRGTLDDKQGVLGLLEAVASLLQDGFQPRRSIVLAFGHDEEIGGEDGAAALAARMREKGWHFQWMVDEGGLIISDNPLLPGRKMAMINVAEKGYITLTLTATGEGGHSSQPPRISTIGRLAAALDRLENNPFPPQLPVPVVAMLEGIAPYMDQPERFIFDNLWLTKSLVAGRMAEDRLTNSFVRTTTALTMINAGVKENVVPQQAEAKVNFRLLPGDTPEELMERVRVLIDDPEIQISASEWNNIPPVSDHEGPGFGAIAAAVETVYPDAVVVPSLLTATTDTRHYVDVADDLYRFHGMVIKSAQATGVHGTAEYIGVDSYLGSIEVARHMLMKGSE
jgi:carboxypeptidase PM20D1